MGRKLGKFEPWRTRIEQGPDPVTRQQFAATDMPFLAAHAAERALAENPGLPRHQLTISRRVQEGLEAVARETATRLGSRLSVAMVMADAQTGDILAEVGSAGFFDGARAGWVDMTRAVRSPGSTLKPFIYGLAFEEGLVAQETIIEDRPSNFGGYRPRNFDLEYQGDVSVRTALQMSLNVPAVRLLDAVGASALVVHLFGVLYFGSCASLVEVRRRGAAVQRLVCGSCLTPPSRVWLGC